MINFLRKRFIKDYNNVNNESVRVGHGKLAAFFGILSNLFLFCVKLIIGIITFNISIITDSINNLSDMSSSIIVLIGFHVSKTPADKEHPFGHERAEYIAGLIVSTIIIVSGVIMAYTGVNDIINYEYKYISLKLSIITSSLLILSILVKIYQAFFNYKIGKIIDSEALKATATDSRNDVISTSLTLFGVVLTMILALNDNHLSFSINGILGIMISLYIIFSGILLFKSIVNPLLGSNQKPVNEEDIINDIKSNLIILGIHDVMYHHYGPTKFYMTIHAEVDAKLALVEAHDSIDETEMLIKNKYGITLTIHIDPVDLNSPELLFLKTSITNIIDEYEKSFNIHDVRILEHHAEPALEFDVIVPYNYSKTDDVIKYELKSRINEVIPNYKLLINIDHE